MPVSTRQASRRGVRVPAHGARRCRQRSSRRPCARTARRCGSTSRCEIRSSSYQPRPGGSTGQTVPYGTSSRVHGRLLDASGNPLAGQQVVVVDHFDNGASIPEPSDPSSPTKRDVLDPRAAGPTRTIEAVFTGTNRYLPAEDEVGKFAVRGAATFRTSADEIREGTPIVFAGRVRHHGARIPAGGKLVEVQYRVKTGRQRTAQGAVSHRSGRGATDSSIDSPRL